MRRAPYACNRRTAEDRIIAECRRERAFGTILAERCRILPADHQHGRRIYPLEFMHDWLVEDHAGRQGLMPGCKLSMPSR